MGKELKYDVTFNFEIEDKYDWEKNNSIGNMFKKSLPCYSAPLLLERNGIGRPFMQKANWTMTKNDGRVPLP